MCRYDAAFVAEVAALGFTDVDNNAVNALVQTDAKSVTELTSDSTSPKVSTFMFDATSGVLVINMNEPVLTTAIYVAALFAICC
jgi:hypothetical protein